MSTYNGEKFIAEQIESLLNQDLDTSKYALSIYCRDDGSSDQTRKILDDYANNYENIKVLEEKNEMNLGVQLSFLTLLKKTVADYYFFCDQDDVWHPSKIRCFLDEFNRADETKPCGVYSDLNIVDSNNKDTGNTMMGLNGWGYNEVRDLAFLTFKSRVTGAAFAINKDLRDMAIKVKDKQFKKIRMHDSFCALIAVSYDNLRFLPDTTVNYRQHGDNVLGAKTKRHPVTDIKYRRRAMQRCFTDLSIMKSVIDINEVTRKNQKILTSALSFWKTNNPVSKALLIVRDYKSFWRFVELKILIFLVVFY